MGPQFRETVYISEINTARKVKSDRAGSHKQELGPRAESFSSALLVRTVPHVQFFQTFEIVRNESS